MILKSWPLRVAFFVVMVLISSCYGFINNADRGYTSLSTFVDEQTPFLKIFILPYLFWYIYLFGIIIWFLITEKSRYYQMVATLILGNIIAFVIYYFFQTTVERPVIQGEDTLSKLILWMHGTDNPYNCFPSLHCYTTYALMTFVYSSKKGHHYLRKAIYLIGSSIILSTLFVKQHVIMDAIAAIILSYIIFYSVSYISKRFQSTKKVLSS